jgi:hypothetical protein
MEMNWGHVGAPLGPKQEMGQEARGLINEGFGTLAGKPVGPNERFSYFQVICAHYRDDWGDSHGTCNTYVLQLPDDTTSFACDGKPLTGTFVKHITGHCQT